MIQSDIITGYQSAAKRRVRLKIIHLSLVSLSLLWPLPYHFSHQIPTVGVKKEKKDQYAETKKKGNAHLNSSRVSLAKFSFQFFTSISKWLLRLNFSPPSQTVDDLTGSFDTPIYTAVCLPSPKLTGENYNHLNNSKAQLAVTSWFPLSKLYGVWTEQFSIPAKNERRTYIRNRVFGHEI